MIKNYNYVLMDLDGTITDPMVGITSCVQHALRYFGVEVKELRDLCCFIGPPLKDSFCEFYHFSEAQAEEAILKYRERFSKIGLYENEVYPGMEELLKQLNDAGKDVLVATSKPEVFARQILEHFQLAQYFTFIGGATLDGTRSRKEEVIDYVLEVNGIHQKEDVLMVGDRKFDIVGAQHAGLISVGVLYGYGNRQEMEEAGAVYIVESVADLRDLLLSK